MGENSSIGWTHHTFNPWWGCTKVSPGCDHCYAETFDRRVHGVGKGHWGPSSPRRVFGENHWAEPLKWQKRAEVLGVRERVFCASMADVFDDFDGHLSVERNKLWLLIKATPNLDWLLLTKRPHNICRMLPKDWGQGYPNVWLGTTVEDQHWADIRVPVLLDVPARVRFLSVEPMIGPVDLGFFLPRLVHINGSLKTEKDKQALRAIIHAAARKHGPTIDWAICGGESGGGARPFDLQWADDLRLQCRDAGVAFFMKQLGAKPVHAGAPYATTHRKGEDQGEWPMELRVQQFPSLVEQVLGRGGR